MKLGKILRYYREQNGYTQEQVANLIHVSERTVGHYETDTRSPSVDTLSLLAEAYEMNITEFFKEIPEENIESEMTIPQFLKWLKSDFEKKTSVVNPNPNMDSRRFKAKIKKEYGNSVRFIETEDEIRVEEWSQIYNKKLAEKLLSLTTRKQTEFTSILYEGVNEGWVIQGKFEGHLVDMRIKECTVHGYHFILNDLVDLRPIKPVFDIVNEWFLNKFKPEHISYAPLVQYYFFDVPKEEILKYNICSNDEILSIRSTNVLVNEKLHSIKDILSLSKEFLVNLPKFGTKSVYEVEYFKKDFKKWFDF